MPRVRRNWDNRLGEEVLTSVCEGRSVSVMMYGGIGVFACACSREIAWDWKVVLVTFNTCGIESAHVLVGSESEQKNMEAWVRGESWQKQYSSQHSDL